MVQMIDISRLQWFRKKDSLTLEETTSLNNGVPFIIPEAFLNVLKFSNGGELDSIFEYYDISTKCMIQNALGFVYGVNRSEYNFGYDIINQHNNPPEFFPKNLVAFGETGNGDMICFDYRINPKTDNPPIVYWNHEADEGQNVSFIANNFDEFIGILREPEPYPGDEEQGNE